jgi:hypothetical protein
MSASVAMHAVARIRRGPLTSVIRKARIVVPAALLLGALSWPLYFSSASFDGSWMAHLWFVWKQSMTSRTGHFPSLFLNYSPGVFYPEYAFYGGTLDALTGALALALGNAPIPAYIITYLLAFAAAYGGWYWLARQAGLGHWQGQIPGIVFITSSYYLTMIYADGDWSEFVAVSMIPLMLASGLSVLQADRLRMGPALALTISGIVFFGSHTLTLVWGSTAIILVVTAIIVCVPQARHALSRRQLLRLAGIATPAMLVSAWFLVPAIAYESSTWVASEYPTWRSVLTSSMFLVAARHLLTLSRSTAAPHNAGFVLSLPSLVMVWALVGFAIAIPTGLREPWMRVFLICAGFTTLMIVLMTHAGLILALPRYYATLQYSYRLENYVLLGLSAAVLCVLVLARGTHPRLRIWTRWALPPILLIAVIGAVQQSAAYPSTGDRNATFARWSRAPNAYENASYEETPLEVESTQTTSPAGLLIEYIDVDQPVLGGSNAHRSLLNGSDVHPPTLSGSYEDLSWLHFPTTAPLGAPISANVALHPGELVNSNLFASPSFVQVKGARIVGINDDNGADVLEVDPASASNSTGGPAAGLISVAPADGLPVILGRVLSICAVIALALQFGRLAVRRLKHVT